MALNDTKQVRYNDPTDLNGAGKVLSDIDKGSGGRQIRTEYWHKKALIEAAKENIFGQLSDTTHMPKHFGKKIVMYHYLPLLSEENVNDQGIDATGATIADGNLYGSSRDVTTIGGKIPSLGETGGRANRVGFSRKTIEGTIEKVGFFTEWSKEAMTFDSDDELYGHLSREMVIAANQIQDDMTQMALLNGAGTVRYAGAATQDSEVTGEGASISEVSYADLQKLGLDLDNLRVPRKTKAITGSRLVDTKIIEAARYMYCGSEMVPTLTRMADHFGNPAYVTIEHYAYSTGKNGLAINGEIGKVAGFRIIQAETMMKWEGAGATATGANAGYAETGGKYDIFPMLVVGDGSFSNIGFSTDGKDTKFKIKYSMPGDDISYSQADPYGEIGFMSIKFFAGTLIFRPERIATLKTVARA